MREDIKTKLTIYNTCLPGDDLLFAILENNVKKDESQTNIYYDDYEVSGWIGGLHKIRFFMNKRKVAEVKLKIENVLEIGGGYKARLADFHRDPKRFVSKNEYDAICRGEKTWEECVTARYPEMAARVDFSSYSLDGLERDKALQILFN